MENILKFMKLIVNLVYSHNIAKWKRFKYEIEAFFFVQTQSQPETKRCQIWAFAIILFICGGKVNGIATLGRISTIRFGLICEA